MFLDRLVANFSGYSEDEIRQGRKLALLGLRYQGELCFDVSLEADGVHIDNYQFYISWQDVVSIVPDKDDCCDITIRGGVTIQAEIISGDLADYKDFIGESAGCDNSAFDSTDLSNENLKRLSAQVEDIEFSETVSTDLRALKTMGLREEVFLANLNVVSRNFWSVLCNLRCSNGRGVKKWIDTLSMFFEVLIRNLKTQIVQCSELSCLCKKCGFGRDEYRVAHMGCGLWYLATMSDAGFFKNIEAQKKSYEGYFVARCYGTESDSAALSALVANGDGARPFGDEVWRRERKVIVCPALTEEEIPDAVIAANGLSINGVMLMSAEDIENYNDSDVGKDLPLVFAKNHPQNGKTYIQHPLQQNRYVDFESYNRSLLESKWEELFWLLERLGATKVTCEVEESNEVERKTSKKRQVEGHVSVAVGGGNSKSSIVSDNASLTKLYSKMSKTARFRSDGNPCIPDGLVFYETELSWQRMAESVLAGRMQQACVDLVFKEEAVVSSKQMRSIEMELNSVVPGYQFGVGGSYADEFEKNQREMRSLIWHYDVTFAEVVAKGDAKAGEKASVKRLSAKSVKKCVTAKSGSCSDGEAMILNRAKRYAKTEDAVKSGMLTDAQKADLEKLASKYGVGELRLEELIDEAFV